MSSIDSSSEEQVDYSRTFTSSKEPEKKDWVKIAACVAVVIGALLALVAILSLFKLFPSDLFGRPHIGSAAALATAATLTLPSIYAIYKRWHHPPRLI